MAETHRQSAAKKKKVNAEELNRHMAEMGFIRDAIFSYLQDYSVAVWSPAFSFRRGRVCWLLTFRLKELTNLCAIERGWICMLAL